MKTFRKALSIILGLAIMLSCIAGMQVSVAAEGTLALSVGEATVADGVVTVPVVAKGSFQALGITVSYDGAVLKLVEAEKAELGVETEDPATNSPFTANPFVMQWAFAKERTDVAVDGTIATLTFNVVEGANLDEATAIDLEVTEAWDVAGKEITATATDGTVTFAKPCEHTNTEWAMTTAPVPATTGDNNGKVSKVCTACGEAVETVSDAVYPPRFAAMQLYLLDKVTIQFTTRAYEFYDEYKVVFEYSDVEGTAKTLEVTEFDLDASNRCVFNFSELLPNQFGDTIVATVYGRLANSSDDTWYLGRSQEYSVLTYCNNQLAKATAKATLKTMCVDLLNYGAAAQTYSGYKTDNLVNKDLTPEQVALASSYPESYTSIMAKLDADNPTVNISAIQYKLEDAISYMLTIKNMSTAPIITDLAGFSVRVSNDKGVIGEISYDEQPELFTALDASGKTILTCSIVNPALLRETTYFEVLKDGVVVSKKLVYNLDSYAASSAVQNGSATQKALVNAIVAYSNGVKAYANDK